LKAEGHRIALEGEGLHIDLEVVVVHTGPGEAGTALGVVERRSRAGVAGRASGPAAGVAGLAAEHHTRVLAEVSISSNTS
jgi:hypothetical protein